MLKSTGRSPETEPKKSANKLLRCPYPGVNSSKTARSVVPKTTTDLPTEIVLKILRPLSRSDLISARLVSKHWSLCAAELFFDVIYISPSKEDIDVFKAITQHPVLSKCPRHLIYNGAEFLSDYSKEEYAKSVIEGLKQSNRLLSFDTDRQTNRQTTFLSSCTLKKLPLFFLMYENKWNGYCFKRQLHICSAVPMHQMTPLLRDGRNSCRSRRG